MKHTRAVYMVTLCLAGHVACSADLPEVTASITSIVRSNYDFIPEHWREDYLQVLRRQERLEDLQAPTQLERFIKLCDWTHSQWKHSRPNPWPLDNAVDILRDIRSGKTGGWCGQFSYVFVDVLKSLGYFGVRYLELASSDNRTHYSTEVWSDEHRKWVAIDPDFNLYMRKTRTGEPASALEVRDSLYGGEPTEAVVIDGGPVRFTEASIYGEEKYKKYYQNVAVSMRADLMRNRRMVDTAERQHTHLFYKDANSQPPRGAIVFHNATTRREDIEYDCNTVRVEHSVAPGVVELSFFTDGSMYNFKGFEAAYGDSDEWVSTTQQLRIEEHKQVTRLRVAPVNQLDQRGVITEVRIAW